MDDLPELPFEKVLSYLNLEDRLRLSAVSRSCREKIIRIKVKSLCFSERPMHETSGWVSGAFPQNFIRSTKLKSFLDAFSKSILSNLKHLCLCDVRFDLNLKNELAFGRTMSSFDQLEELLIIRVKCSPHRVFKLNLPMLTRVHLKELTGANRLTLDAPRLREIEFLDCTEVMLDTVRHESVESFLFTSTIYRRYRGPLGINLKKVIMNWRNLQYLHVDCFPYHHRISLSSLKQLKEIHLQEDDDVWEMFYEKQRHGRADLKIYLCGLLLNGPDDPARKLLLDSSPEFLEDRESLNYWAIKRVAPELEVDLLRRFTELNEIKVNILVQDIQRFLDLLKNVKNISSLKFTKAQPQDLFDLLPEHCAIQRLTIFYAPSDLAFLFRLKHLIHLDTGEGWPIDAELVRKAFEELPVLSSFEFENCDEWVTIENDPPKFVVSTSDTTNTFSDLNAALEFIFVKRQEKRKAEEME